VIYVRAVLELLRSEVPVHGLAHITGGGLLNLLRLNEAVGFTIEDPLPVPPIIELVKARGGVSEAEAWEVFNMGCGFVVVTPEPESATALLERHHPGARRIGTVTDEAGSVRAPGVAGTRTGLHAG
jgi:phosphoribosylformylglycinamidine cyclo-ligase